MHIGCNIQRIDGSVHFPRVLPQDAKLGFPVSLPGPGHRKQSPPSRRPGSKAPRDDSKATGRLA